MWSNKCPTAWKDKIRKKQNVINQWAAWQPKLLVLIGSLHFAASIRIGKKVISGFIFCSFKPKLWSIDSKLNYTFLHQWKLLLLLEVFSLFLQYFLKSCAFSHWCTLESCVALTHGSYWLKKSKANTQTGKASKWEGRGQSRPVDKSCGLFNHTRLTLTDWVCQLRQQFEAAASTHLLHINPPTHPQTVDNGLWAQSFVCKMQIWHFTIIRIFPEPLQDLRISFIWEWSIS